MRHDDPDLFKIVRKPSRPAPNGWVISWLEPDGTLREQLALVDMGEPSTLDLGFVTQVVPPSED